MCDKMYGQILLTVVCLPWAALAQRRVIYVLPEDEPLTQCPVENCYNLTSIISDDLLLDDLSNTTIALLPGTHICSSAVNKVVSINSATDFVLRAANSSAGATIKCSGSIGLEFSFCSNLTIIGVTIEGCGAHKVIKECAWASVCSSKQLKYTYFTLYISYSFDVHVTKIAVTNGTGIGLLVVNVQHQFELSNSKFVFNMGNFLILTKDNEQIVANYTDIKVENSLFREARRKSFSLSDTHLSGIRITAYQTKFSVVAELINIVLEQNDINLLLGITSCNQNAVLIKDLMSVNTGRDMRSRFNLLYSPTCAYVDNPPIAPNNVISVYNGHFSGSGLYFEDNSRSRKDNYTVVLSNIMIKNSHTRHEPLEIKNIKNITLCNVTVINSHIRVYIQHSNVHLMGDFMYHKNSGAVQITEQTSVSVHRNSNISFKHNYIHNSESPFYCTNSEITVLFNSFVTFENNTGQQCGGITLIHSFLKFMGSSHVDFLDNNGRRGGAMALYQESQIVFSKGVTNLTFIRNDASVVGGAIFVQDFDYLSGDYLNNDYKKFLIRQSKDTNPTFHFINNTAIQAGSAVYGGSGNSKDFHFNNSQRGDLSVATSNPFKVCMCINSIPDCSIISKEFKLIPGQVHKIEVVAVGQWDGTVPANIQAKFTRQVHGKLERKEYIQSVERNCTNLTYNLQFSHSHEGINLRILTTYRVLSRQPKLYLLFFRQNCTIGFSYDTNRTKCICNQILSDHGIECDFNTMLIKRLSPKWISGTYTHLPPAYQAGVIVHNHCPFDYCIPTDDVAQSLDLLNPDQQCAFNRSGILCGTCQSNFSHILGTSKCKQCTTPWIAALIVPLTAMAGVALVIGLMLLNLTVSVGTINGLIFYANIVRANNAIFFPYESATSFLSIFIAWLNLDLGIETCFYDGLNAYSKTGFQFLFPLYIWLVVVVIIVVSHYSTRASKLFGNNAVQVLATLFLLSYAKLLRIIITVFSSTELVYPDGYVRRVWLYDGNVDYLQGKHIPLFVAALLLLTSISIPYTATLLCIQWLQKISHYKPLFWIIKLQPFFDAYTGPYKINYRYWTGLLLLMRIFLFLIFSLNTLDDPTINLLAIAVTASCILSYIAMTGGVYKIIWVNYLEITFSLNLVVLSAVSLYQISAYASLTHVTYTSTGITFVLFSAIVLYHSIRKIIQPKELTKLIRIKLNHCLIKRNDEDKNEEGNESESDQVKLLNEVTYSVVELTKTSDYD